MDRDELDAIIVADNADVLHRGFLRYVSDWRLWIGGGYFVLPRAAPGALIVSPGSHGHWAGAAARPYATVATGDAVAAVARAVGELGMEHPRLGLVGHRDAMPIAHHERLLRELPSAAIVDATALVQRAMLFKSPTEVARASASHTAVGRALDTIAETIRPGMTERRALAPGAAVLFEHGCLDGYIHLSHDDAPYLRPATERRITADDVLKVQIEASGENGYWVELAMVVSFRPPSASLALHFAATAAALERCAGLLRPGATVSELRAAVTASFTDAGLHPTPGDHGGYHGIGLNLVEPPTDRDGVGIEAGMLIMLSPNATVVDHAWGMFLPDSFFVNESGSQPLHDMEHRWRVCER